MGIARNPANHRLCDGYADNEYQHGKRCFADGNGPPVDRNELEVPDGGDLLHNLANRFQEIGPQWQKGGRRSEFRASAALVEIEGARVAMGSGDRRLELELGGPPIEVSGNDGKAQLSARMEGERLIVEAVEGGTLVRMPQSLLDNSPLRALLGRNVRFSRIAHGIEQGWLDAVSVTAAGGSRPGPTGASRADDRHVTMDVGVLKFEDRPFFPRIIRHQLR